eukprot:528748_1
MIHHCIYIPTTTLSKYGRITNTPINTTLNNHYYYSPFQHTIQQHSSLTHIPQQFVGPNQPQVVPLNQFHCYNNSTMLLLLLQLYSIYSILIYVIYLLQFVDCLQPQVVIITQSKTSLYQYEQLLRAAFSHMIRTTTTTESITKYTAATPTTTTPTAAKPIIVKPITTTPTAATPTATTPTAAEPTAATPNITTPTATTPTAAEPTAATPNITTPTATTP